MREATRTNSRDGVVFTPFTHFVPCSFQGISIPESLRQHLNSLAHTPQMFHCPVSLLPNYQGISSGKASTEGKVLSHAQRTGAAPRERCMCGWGSHLS